MEKQRVAVLDSFRCFAIIAVMLMHYTYRWTPPANSDNLYPYGNFFGTTFHYGFLGVQFFFIISGFVISYTLENTSGMASFFKNRFIRLWPPMVLCSVITFLVCIMFDNKHEFESAQTLRNFLPSLTFTKPSIWVTLTHKDWSYISLSYWSLWVEVQFYVIAAVLFFANRRTFFRNLIIFTVFLNLVHYIPERVIDPASYPHSSRWVNMLLARFYYNRLHFDIKDYLSLFTIGVVFHHLYKQRTIRWGSLGIGVIFIFANQLYQCDTWQIRVAYLVMICLFLFMVYRSQYLSVIDNAFFRRVGVISYTIYLIHETIGVLMINKLGGYLGSWSPIAPLIVGALMIGFAELSYRVYEKRVSKWLKSILFAKPKVHIYDDKMGKAATE